MEYYDMSEVEKRNGESGEYWLVIKGEVYDVTSYVILNTHPGGNEVLFKYAGKDATINFTDVHSQDAWKELEQFRIGKLNSDWFYKRWYKSLMSYLSNHFILRIGCEK